MRNLIASLGIAAFLLVGLASLGSAGIVDGPDPIEDTPSGTDYCDQIEDTGEFKCIRELTAKNEAGITRIK